MTTLPEKVVAIDRALASIPHAFGGALALAYYAEPRATLDIDVNVFVDVDRAHDVFGPLGDLGVNVASAERPTERDGQVRVLWGDTPVDLFFAYDRFHHAAAQAVETVPFGDVTIPILAVEHLVVCKVVFDRPKDWLDIETVLDLGTPIEAGEVLRWVGRILGDDDRRYDRIAALLASDRSG